MKKLLLLFTLVGFVAYAQKKQRNNTTQVVNSQQQVPNTKLYNALKWRNIGPFRGGRSLATAGHAQQPLTYYFGAVGGGVWKTTDGGANWFCVSDSVFRSSSVGAIAVAPSDANVVYVGMGEADMRSNISFGDGMYKSTDAGKTWKHIGLPKADAIATIEVHPKDANLLYVAAVGNPFAPNPERGVFRSKDGGQTWQQILSKNDSTGAYHVRIDPNNPRVIYASLWQAYRNGHSMSSGGAGCGLYKSVDGGDTWVCLNQKAGMPKGLLGKIGIAVSPANSNRLYAMIENAKGGLYRSDDGGEHWQLINEDKNLWQRPWYYMNIQADPKNENGLIVLNVNAMKSGDGGKTFSRIAVHHGDTHDIWINPNDGNNFIIADDGGGEVTYNGGATFSELDIPTAQFYHVSLDNDFPYNIYGAQQDNTSVRIASRTDGYSIGSGDWYSVAGGEAGYIQADPKNSKITFGGEYDGQLTKHNADNNQNQDISPYPESNMGYASAEKKYRFQWTYPIVFSPHDPTRLYVTSQYVHVSQDYGHSWEIISPDLTRNDPKTTGPTGGPITKDQTGAEIYATIFTFAESPNEKGVYWAGSDDGFLHISKDAGKNWENISLPTSQLPEFALMSIIHTSEHAQGKAYLAANRYMSGDRKPYLFKTSDYGKTWTKITNGIPEDEYCRVVRDDPNKAGLLYAGTERGIYVSFNDGDSWSPLNLNLPNTPIRDLQIHKREKDLVVATHGRSFWVLDDVTPLHEIADKVAQESKNHLFKPRHAYRMQGGEGGWRVVRLDEGQNAPNGVLVRYLLANKGKEEVKLQFLTAKGDTIATYSNQKDPKGKALETPKDFYTDENARRPNVLKSDAGMNSFVWDMRYPSPETVEGTNVVWNGPGVGAKVVPDTYKVRLIVGKDAIAEQSFEILSDPRLNVPKADLQEQFDLHRRVNAKISETARSINSLRKIRKQLNDYTASIKDTTITPQIKKLSKPLLEKLDKIESKLMQPKARAGQDVLALPIQLNDKLANVANAAASAETKPTKGTYDVFKSLSEQVDVQIKSLREVIEKEVPAINDLIKKLSIPAIVLD